MHFQSMANKPHRIFDVIELSTIAFKGTFPAPSPNFTFTLILPPVFGGKALRHSPHEVGYAIFQFCFKLLKAR